MVTIRPRLLEDYVGKEQARVFSELILMDETNFVALSLGAQLDPALDFLNSDLRDVDFSNCDLSNFRFNGSDLRGSFGVNIVFPSVDNLIGCETTDSPFDFVAGVGSKIFKDKSLESRLYFDELDPLTVSTWISESTRRGSKGRDRAIEQAIWMFSSCEDPTIIKSVIYQAGQFFEKSAEYRAFLMWVIASKGGNSHAFSSVLRVLSRVFRDDPNVHNLMLSVFENDLNMANKQIAYGHIIAAAKRGAIPRAIVSRIASDKFRDFRKALIRSAIGARADRYYFLFEDGVVQSRRLLIDFTDIVRPDLWARMLREIARRRRTAELIDSGSSAVEAKKLARDVVDFSRDELGGAARVLVEAFHHLRKFGIVFNFDSDIMNALPSRVYSSAWNFK
jgi:Pentapeptide repeats (8 copies)